MDEVKLFGVFFCNTFSSAPHINHLLTVCNQCLFLLSQLKNHGLALVSLHIVYQAIVQSKITYTLPVFGRQLACMDISQFAVLARKATHCGLVNTLPSMREYYDQLLLLFKWMQNPA